MNKFDETKIRKYIKDVEKYLAKDNREVNYQNRIAIPFLQYILSENIDIVDTSTLYRNWNRRQFHDRSKYANHYTPDVLISKNWTIYNKDIENIEYLSLVEIKAPTANDRKHADMEKDEYLNKVPFVILTDCITWELHRKNKTPEIIYFENEHSCQKVCKRGDVKEIDWKSLNDLHKEFEKLVKSIQNYLFCN